MTDTAPTTTEVRTALVKEASSFYDRRQPYHRAMCNSPKGDPNHGALFDAYEGLVAAGCYAEALAAILRITEQRHGEQAAASFAAIVHDVMENGNDGLEDANSDVWALIDRQSDTAAVSEVAR